MRGLLIIDMQVGLLAGDPPPRGIDAVVKCINCVARVVRQSQGVVVYVQHHGEEGDAFAPGSPGWRLLPSLEQRDEDLVIAKTTCDSFYETELDAELRGHGVDELLVSGWATDYCVDTTVRAAASRNYETTVIRDAHTAADRPHLEAASVIRHHNATWADLIVPGRPIRVVSAESILHGEES